MPGVDNTCTHQMYAGVDLPLPLPPLLAPGHQVPAAELEPLFPVLGNRSKTYARIRQYKRRRFYQSGLTPRVHLGTVQALR